MAIHDDQPLPDKNSLPRDGQRPMPAESPMELGWLVVALVIGGLVFMAWQGGLFEQASNWLAAEKTAGDTGPAMSPEPPSAVSTTADGNDTDLRAEADAFVEDLVKTPPRKISASEISHFVAPDQKILLPGGLKYKEVAIRDLAEQTGVGENEPITIIINDKQLEYRTVRELLNQAANEPDAEFNLLVDEEHITRYTSEQLRREYDGHLDETVTVMVLKPRQQVTTARELREKNAPETIVRIVQSDSSKESDTVTTVSEMLHGLKGNDEGDVYHVHTVRDNDSQGLWGIIHDGLVENFAQGIALNRGESVHKYRINIPRHADEMIDSQTSSYLGKKIHDKTRESYRYNHSKQRMGTDPNTIHPYQELVITRFTSEELVQIYEHFVNVGRQNNPATE